MAAPRLYFFLFPHRWAWCCFLVLWPACLILRSPPENLFNTPRASLSPRPNKPREKRERLCLIAALHLLISFYWLAIYIIQTTRPRSVPKHLSGKSESKPLPTLFSTKKNMTSPFSFEYFSSWKSILIVSYLEQPVRWNLQMLAKRLYLFLTRSLYLFCLDTIFWWCKGCFIQFGVIWLTDWLISLSSIKHPRGGKLETAVSGDAHVKHTRRNWISSGIKHKNHATKSRLNNPDKYNTKSKQFLVLRLGVWNIIFFYGF